MHRATSVLRFALLLAGGLVLCPPAATASSCERSENNLDPCDVLSSSICNNPSSWTPSQWIQFNNWHYADTLEIACDKYWKKWNPDEYTGISAVFATSNPLNFDCYMDGNGDGVADPNDSAYYSQVHTATVTRDTCCDLTPRGPYSGLGTSGTAGTDFSSTQIGQVRSTNQTRNVRLRSDAGVVNKSPVKPVGVDYYDVLYLFDAYFKGDRSAAAQVDHIIPQKDSKGCGCGKNSYANALLISGKLNNEMSNNCLDPKRLQILGAYTQ